MIDPKALEAMAEAMWQAESIRARGVGRKIPWGEVAEKTKDQWSDFAQSALTAYHKHLAEAGLVIVPMEPTDVMVKAGVDLAFRIRLSPEYSWKDYMRDLHRAMIAALGGESHD
jgi:hypothetical protein